MASEHEFATVNTQEIASLLERYPSIVPTKLSDLDTSRYDTIPTTLAARTASDDTHLTKDELVALVDWKLSHGTFRPTLKALVNQNSEETVKSTTRDAFSTFDASSVDSVKRSLNILTELKGIGPATASLALSVYEPVTAPFFSDELFRWAFWQEGTSKGWDRPIKYSLKEYLELFEKVQQRVDRDGLKSVDLEKAAYVLGKGAGKKDNKQPEITKDIPVKTRVNDNQRSANASEETALNDTDGNVNPGSKRKKTAEEQASKEAPAKKAKNVKSNESKDGKAPRTATRSSTRLKKS